MTDHRITPEKQQNSATIERPGLASTGAKRSVEVRFDAERGEYQITIIGEGRKRHAMAVLAAADATDIAAFIEVMRPRQPKGKK